MPAGSPLEDPKLSAARSVNFRPGVVIVDALDALAKDTGRKHSDILRDSITAYWPEIEALNRNLARNASPADVAKVRQWIDACQQAAELGVDPAQTLRDAVAGSLT